MRMNSLFMLSLILLGCKSTGLDSIDTKDLQKVEVQYVNIEVITPVSVNCNEFERYFDVARMSRKIFAKTSQWERFITEINRVIRNGKRFNEPVDVRMKVFLHYHTGVRIICIGHTLISLDDHTYVVDDSFRAFIMDHFSE